MGLLDQMTYDPTVALGMGLLQAGGNFRMPVSMGQGLAQGFGQMQETAALRNRQKLMEQEQAMRELQMQQMQQKQAEHEAMQQAARDSFQSPAQQALSMGGGPTNANAALLPNLQPRFDQKSFLANLAKVNPLAAMEMEAKLKKDPIKLGEGDTLLDPTTYKPLASGGPKAAALPWYVKQGADGKTMIDPAYSDFEKTKAAYGRPPAQPMAPVAYVDDKGQTVWGTISEAKGRPAANFNPMIQGQIAGAKEGAKTEAETRTKAALDAPRIIQNAETALRLSDELVKHPGFEQAVGKSSMFGIQKIPGTDARDFMNRLDQVKGSAFLEAFNSLKGGGQITEIEGKKATDAIARMDNSTSESEFKQAIKDYQDIIKKGVGRAKMNAKPVGPVADPSPSVDSLLEKYK